MFIYRHLKSHTKKKRMCKYYNYISETTMYSSTGSYKKKQFFVLLFTKKEYSKVPPRKGRFGPKFSDPHAPSYEGGAFEISLL